MSARATFGPPRNAFGAFGWAVLQLPRAFLWQVRERELRGLAFVPALLTFGLGSIGCLVAVLSAGPLQERCSIRRRGSSARRRGSRFGWA